MKMQFKTNHLVILPLLHIIIHIANCAPADDAPGSTSSKASSVSTTTATISSNALNSNNNPNAGDKERKKSDFYEYRLVVAEGITQALADCRQKFKWDRWNCPPKAFRDILTGESLPSNKEFGLSRAFIASSVVLSLFRSCSRGSGHFCGCSQPTSFISGRVVSPESLQHIADDSQYTTTDDQISTEPPSKFSWAGCEETVRLGYKVSQIYLGFQDSDHDKASKLINAHNYEVGRHALRRHMKVKCKCHGTSGACQVRTCWNVLPNLSEVGDYLRRQYRDAAKVGAMSAIESNPVSLRKELMAINPNKLVFIDASPDYCYEHPHLGINGTLNRTCSEPRYPTAGGGISRSERESCNKLCTKCGYKIKREKTIVEKQCDCRFLYCCDVKCSKCAVEEETFRCVRHS